mgnify:CR=1 FL=1
MLRNIYVYIKYITIGSDELNIIKQNLDKEVNLFIPDDIEEIDFEDSLVITDVPENEFKMQAEACGKDSCEVKGLIQSRERVILMYVERLIWGFLITGLYMHALQVNRLL